MSRPAAGAHSRSRSPTKSRLVSEADAFEAVATHLVRDADPQQLKSIADALERLQVQVQTKLRPALSRPVMKKKQASPSKSMPREIDVIAPCRIGDSSDSSDELFDVENAPPIPSDSSSD